MNLCTLIGTIEFSNVAALVITSPSPTRSILAKPTVNILDVGIILSWNRRCKSMEQSVSVVFDAITSSVEEIDNTEF